MPHLAYNEANDNYVAIMENGDAFVLTTNDHDDEDICAREFALRKHLDNWTDEIKYEGSNLFEVNPHMTTHELSPDEIRAKVQYLKDHLAKVKSYQPNASTPEVSSPNLHLMTIQEMQNVSYKTLEMMLHRDAPETLSDSHVAVNVLHMVAFYNHPTYPHEQAQVAAYQAAWEGRGVPDLRVWYPAYGSEWYVMTDDEADTAWDEELDHYIDECMEIPRHVEPYFDRERWKKDARMDGRGHSLSSYDGREDRVVIAQFGTEAEYYLFRRG